MRNTPTRMHDETDESSLSPVSPPMSRARRFSKQLLRQASLEDLMQRAKESQAAKRRAEQPRLPDGLVTAILAVVVVGVVLIVMALFERGTDFPGHAAFALTGISFALSDVLWLRVLATLSNFLTIVYSYWHPTHNRLWVPIVWNTVYVVVNSSRIFLILKERIVFLSTREQQIFDRHFQDAMSAPDFHKLIRRATFVHTTERHTLIRQAAPVSQLVLITDGFAEVEVGEGVCIQHGEGIIGEKAFLEREGTASATVSALPDCQYYSWDMDALGELRRKAKAASRGLELAISRGLSKKLSHANQEMRNQVRRNSGSSGPSLLRAAETAVQVAKSISPTGRRKAEGGGESGCELTSPNE